MKNEENIKKSCVPFPRLAHDEFYDSKIAHI